MDTRQVVGRGFVLGRDDDGDYRVTFPEGCEPQEVSSIKPEDLWLTSDFPDWVYAPDGERMGKEADIKPTYRIPLYLSLIHLSAPTTHA